MKKFLACSTALSFSLFFQNMSYAQSAVEPPKQNITDENGVDLTDASFNFSHKDVSIGSGDGELSYISILDRAGWSNNFDYKIVKNTPSSGEVYYTVWRGRTSEKFLYANGIYTSVNQKGSSLTSSSSGYIYRYSDGTEVSLAILNDGVGGTYSQVNYIAHTDGRRENFFYTTGNAVITPCTYRPCTYKTSSRLNSIVSSSGYQLKFIYPTAIAGADNWRQVSKIIALNNAIETCSTSAFGCVPSGTWPTITIVDSSSGANYIRTVTDSLGRTWQYTSSSSSMFPVTGFKGVGSNSDDISISYSGNRVSAITEKGIAWTYAVADVGDVRTLTATSPQNTTLVSTSSISNETLSSTTNALGQKTIFKYDNYGRLTHVVEPEGTVSNPTPNTESMPLSGYTKYTYDARGNVTETRMVSKTPGTPPDIVTTANYPATCTDLLICNKPTWTKDASGKQTDYTYSSAHGGLLTVTEPADVSGVRPQTRYTYAAMQAYFKDAGGSVTASGISQYKLTSVSMCLTATAANPSSCVGTANESETIIGYGPQIAGTSNNLLPVNVTLASGDNSIIATSAMTYDGIGNLVSVDGPLSGTVDTTVYRYDAARQLIGIVGPDPDGNGPRTPAAHRTTYNPNGTVAIVELGTVADQSDAAWLNFNSLQQASTTYDAYGRPAQTKLTAGGATYSVAQQNYDSLGRVNCVVQRSDPAQWGSQTAANACAPQTTSANGPDRVTKTSYDTVGRVSKMTSAYGTSAQSDDVQYAYTPNGKIAYVKDANLNRTTYEYDGFDRLIKTRYPVVTKGADTSSSTDFEALTYGDNVHVTQVRLRDGDSSTIGYAYDNLGRTKTVTPSGEAVISYTYDLAGRLLTTQRGSLLLTNVWDALGRLTSESQPFGSMAYQYNAAGSVTRRTWSDGFYVNYDYDNLGQVTAIRENGATSGIGVLATYSYDNLGRRTGANFGNGTSRTYAFDAVSRLAGLKIDVAGTANDIVIGAVGGVGTAIGYNPASQITSIARNNDAYAWTGHYNFDRGYTTNGLNQYTSSGAVALGYDARGNLTSSGGTTYTYSKLNELTAAAGATLYYDGLSRLVEYDAPSSTRFYYSGSQIAAEVGNPSGAILRRYVPGPGTDEPVMWYEGSGTTDRRWLQADERGSVVAVTDATGAAIKLNTYDEYGIPQSSNLGRFQYTGQVWLGEIGLAYYKARMYSPSLGRFMQTDPIGYGDGMNWYNYVGGDPVNATDPNGLSCTEVWEDDANGNHIKLINRTCSGGGVSGGRGGVIDGGNGGRGGGQKPSAPTSQQQSNCPTPARLSSLDGFIDGAVGAFNGSADAGPVPLPADLVKAMVAVESGYNRNAYINDPMQVNVPGDWVPRKAEWGLVRGSAPGQAVGIVAGIGWLSYKAFRYDSSGNRASFLGWEAAAVRYNGGGDPNYLSKVQAARAHINGGC